MFRGVERPVSYKRRAREWINKMLFLWAREPTPSPKSAWLTWLTTAAFFWTCRRPILRALRGAVSPLRIRPSRLRPINREKPSRILHPTFKVTGIRSKVKRLGTGDGPHLTPCSVNKIPHKIHYRVTRSGRVYGTYVPQ